MTERKVSELYGRHQGEDIYVVGTGTSMRVFPPDFLAGRTVIGCNMAWKFAPITYGVTIHADLNMPEFIDGEAPRPDIPWITKRDKTRKLLSEDQFQQVSEQFYYFESEGQPNTAPVNEPLNSGRILDWVRRPSGDYLYQWSSISQTAANLAANLGARSVILIGCDNCALLDNHHAHQQHTRWKGVAPSHRYHQYYEGLAEVRGALRERGIPLLSLTPFATLCDPGEDFGELCDELGLPLHIDNPEMKAGKSGLARLKRRIKKSLKGK